MERTIMQRPVQEARIEGIEEQIGFLESQIRRESKKNMVFFLIGLAAGLLTNIAFLMLSI